jgi:hypothetical protein
LEANNQKIARAEKLTCYISSLLYNAPAFHDSSKSASSYPSIGFPSISHGTFGSGVSGRFVVTAEIAGRREQVRVTVTGKPRRPKLKSRSFIALLMEGGLGAKT